MFERLIRALKGKLCWIRHGSVLNYMTEMEQFRDYVLRVQPQLFLQYQEGSRRARMEFQSVVRELSLNLRGSRFLDIGPGYGDSLDICHEEGARCIEFVEIDPFFFTYNRLKEFAKGYQMNHLTGLGRMGSKEFDLIWIKGSVSADLFIARNEAGMRGISLFHWLTRQIENFASSPRFIMCPPLSHWLTQLESLASSTCQIIICPHWLKDGQGRKCRDVHHNFFTDTMLAEGYVILPEIRDHNCEPEYPITLYKNESSISRDG